MRYRVEARPENGGRLYMARRYREMHDGPFTESFDNRLTWEKLDVVERKIEAEKRRLPNRVHGNITFKIVEEPLE